jgi:hypothetical protein
MLAGILFQFMPAGAARFHRVIRVIVLFLQSRTRQITPFAGKQLANNK